MANILIAHLNRWDEATLTATSQLTTLPLANTQSEHIAEKFRTASGVSTVTVTADYGSAVALGVFAALGTNLTNVATHRLTLSNVSTGASELLDTSTVSASVVTGYPQVYYVLGSTITARYASWTFNCSAPTVSPSGTTSYLEFGRIFSSPIWQPLVNLQYGWSMAWADASRRVKSRGGQTHIDPGARNRVLDFTLDFETEAQMYDNAFEIDRLVGLNTDILAMRDNAGVYRSQQSVFGLIVQSTPITNTEFNIFQKRYTVEERL